MQWETLPCSNFRFYEVNTLPTRKRGYGGQTLFELNEKGNKQVVEDEYLLQPINFIIKG